MASELKSYVVIDVTADGRTIRDTFQASHHAAAKRRAQFAAEGETLALWCDEQLVGRWRRCGRRSFEPIVTE